MIDDLKFPGNWQNVIRTMVMGYGNVMLDMVSTIEFTRYVINGLELVLNRIISDIEEGKKEVKITEKFVLHFINKNMTALKVNTIYVKYMSKWIADNDYVVEYIIKEIKDGDNEIRRDEIEHFVTEYIGDDYDIGISTGDYLNGYYLDGIVDAIEYMGIMDKSIPKHISDDIEKNFSDDLNDLVDAMSDTIVDGDDFKGKIDEEFVKGVVESRMNETNTGLDQDSEYVNEFVSLLSNKKFLKEFVIKRLKKKNPEGLFILKYIDKKTYEKNITLLKPVILKQIRNKEYKHIPILKDINMKLYDKFKHLYNVDAYDMFN